MTQKNIPHYINDPVINRLTAPQNKLIRPKINYLRALLFCGGIAIINLLVAYILSIRHGLILWKIYIVLMVITVALLLRYIFIWFVKLYQRYAKAETRLKCCYTPSCSNYAILAFKKYGAIIGGIKTIRRLFRCKPPGGIDYP